MPSLLDPGRNCSRQLYQKVRYYPNRFQVNPSLSFFQMFTAKALPQLQHFLSACFGESELINLSKSRKIGLKWRIFSGVKFSFHAISAFPWGLILLFTQFNSAITRDI